MTNTCDTSIYHAARLAAQSLLHRLDRNAHFRPFFDLSIHDGRMRARHASWDCVDMSARFTDAWISARQMFDWPMTEEEAGVRAYLLAMQNPADGLFYDRSVPDGIGIDDGIPTGETCCNTDLIHLGVKLAECGFEECLDYVEIMVRNQLMENQIRDVSRFQFQSPEVKAMTLGAYDSWVMPNGLTGCSELGLEGCCTASAIRAIYLAWQHAIRYANGVVDINLMMTRRSEWLDTISHQPFEGRFSILIRKPVSVMVRMPAWINLREIKVNVNGAHIQPAWVSSHLRIEHAQPGSRIELEFPIPERQTEEEIVGHSYGLSWRGPTLMKIDPPGEVYPIFQRTLGGLSELNTLALDDLRADPSVAW